jgi:hypothetical protein
MPQSTSVIYQLIIVPLGCAVALPSLLGASAGSVATPLVKIFLPVGRHRPAIGRAKSLAARVH